jgi:hypothetical protein
MNAILTAGKINSVNTIEFRNIFTHQCTNDTKFPTMFLNLSSYKNS